MNENLLEGMNKYLDKAFTGMKPVLGAIITGIGYIMFPTHAYFLSLMAVLAAALMDIFTKIYSICKKNGGYEKSVKSGKVFSKTLWKGTEVKIVSILSISILTGLSYRVIYLKQAGILIASFVYSVLFMREFQSNIENLIEAGADLNWLLLFAKRKQKNIMDNENIEDGSSDKEMNNEYDKRI